MVSISLCMIVRNEEKVLGRCLSCVRGFADEIIIVDTGSTTGRRRSHFLLRTRFMILNGRMTLQRREISRFPRERGITCSGWMQMMW